MLCEPFWQVAARISVVGVPHRAICSFSLSSFSL